RKSVFPLRKNVFAARKSVFAAKKPGFARRNLEFARRNRGFTGCKERCGIKKTGPQTGEPAFYGSIGGRKPPGDKPAEVILIPNQPGAENWNPGLFPRP
ncbi:MAG: hypothetical protein LBE17_13795, partial [Treponema sp.]|nr:hypothetical protein [Treponema sp.]